VILYLNLKFSSYSHTLQKLSERMRFNWFFMDETSSRNVPKKPGYIPQVCRKTLLVFMNLRDGNRTAWDEQKQESELQEIQQKINKLAVQSRHCDLHRRQMKPNETMHLPMLCGRNILGNPVYFPKAEFRGRKIYFCTEYCRNAFESAPDRFYEVHRPHRMVSEKDK
jgi:YHS domain-containing protein